VAATARAVDWPPRSQGAAGSRASTPHLTTSEVHLTRAEPEHAHPITERHERLREQQALIGALNDALDLADAAALRALLERYDAVQPEDPMRLAEGYERVADCIEADEAQAGLTVEATPSSRETERDRSARASVRANAQRYYDDARASSVRRYVRRFCLEDSSR